MGLRATQNLLPRPLVEQAGALTREAFDLAVNAPLLLVRVDGPASELALGLGEASAAGGTRIVPTLGFETVVGVLPDVAAAPARTSWNGVKLQTLLVKSIYFAAPLKKRPSEGKPFSATLDPKPGEPAEVLWYSAKLNWHAFTGLAPVRAWQLRRVFRRFSLRSHRDRRPRCPDTERYFRFVVAVQQLGRSRIPGPCE